ncbi:probable (S)-N-methylcoclaurine 3'-hydroxylase isozyme 2 [Malania oleifera]|uniref:probable (S)-N-methylcoclaurine 3'-hydroxylase isozyme 2 n=1 Tax=Malania oleifera TaxID=397392 RepID=UPI0025ADD30F|nr:probable (S)-N-methylcoclaurine 3'-hydroxylase isozyme 2 [Malania oleifera]
MDLPNFLAGDISFFPTLLLIAPLFYVLLKNFVSAGSPSSLPPGPRTWPIVGNILQMRNMTHVTLTNLAKVHGPLMSLRLGSQLLIVGSSPAAAMEILKTHDRVFSGRYIMHAVPVKSPELNHLSLLFASECNDQWKSLRAIFRTELLSPTTSESQLELREKKVREMVGVLGKKEGEVVNLGEIVFATAFNTISNIIFSKDLTNLERRGAGEEFEELIKRFLELISLPNISDLYPILGRWDIQGIQKKGLEIFRRMSTIWNNIVKERRQGKASRSRDLMDALSEIGFNNDQMNQFFLELFMAGTENTAEITVWTMAELIKNHEAMDKLHEELANVVHGNIVRESHLPQLPYLEACVKETMRLHPPAPFLLAHRNLEACKVMGYDIPKDSQVLVNVWAISRDPKHWEDALSFKPERFLNSSLDYKGHNFEFLPFGAGRRICPGLPIAARQIPLLVATLVHLFNWSLPGNMDAAKLDMAEKFATALKKEQPLYLIPRVRVHGVNN